MLRPPFQCHRSALLLLLGAACSSGNSVAPPPPPPPPAPPVTTTVVVSSPSPSLVAGDSLQLTATVKDQNGTPLLGKTPVWSTSAPGVVTVSATGLAKGVAQGTATISAAVDGKSGSTQLAVAPLVRIVADTTKAVSATIGRAGGRLTATSSAGLVYEFEVPRLALDSNVRITVTPVKAFKQLPLSGGLVGAMTFEPSGLRFRVPAILTIRTTPAVPANMRLVGFTAVGDGDSLLVEPAVRAAGAVQIAVSHFSTAGGGLGTVTDIRSLPVPPNSSAEVTAEAALAGLSMPADQAAITAALRTWYLSLKSRLQFPAVTDTQVFDLQEEYGAWKVEVAQADDPAGDLARAIKPEFDDLLLVMADTFRRGIDFANQQCLRNRSLVAAQNALTLAALALLEGLGGEPGLDGSSVIGALCVAVVVTDTTYPDPAAPNVTQTLQLRFGFVFKNLPTTVENSIFKARLDIRGSTADGTPLLNTDNLGKASIPIRPTGLAPLQVQARACFDPATLDFFPLDPQLDGTVCVLFRVDRIFGRTIVGDVAITTDVGLSQIADVAKIDGNLVICCSGVTSSDLHELPLLTEVTQTLTISMLPNLTSLSGLAGMTKLGGLVLGNLPLMHRPVLPFGVTDLPVVLGLVNSPIDDLGGFLGVTRIGLLVLDNLPVSSLVPLARTRVEGIHLARLPNLTSLNGLQPTPVLNQLFLNDGNTTLTDISALSGVTDVAGSFGLLTGAYTSLAAFRSLRTVQNLRLDPGTVLASYDFPALTQVGNGGVLIESRGPCGSSLSSIVISMPSLVTSGGLTFSGAGVASCPIDLLLPAATIGGQVILNRGGLRRLSLKTVSMTPNPNFAQHFRIENTLDLVAIDLSLPIDLPGDLRILNNVQLSAISGLAGRVGGKLMVQSNAALSTNLIDSWPLTVGGTRTVFGNKFP